MPDLDSPPELPPPGDHPHLRLIPEGPPVVFRLPKDPEVPWQVRAVAIFLGVTISTVVVIGIIFMGSLVKDLYDRVDAAQKAREAVRQEAPKARDGTIPIVIHEEQPQPPPPPPAEKNPPAAGSSGAADRPRSKG